MKNDEYWIRNYVVDNKIADLRKEKGISQEELGMVVGLSRNAISSLERGAAYPTIRSAFLISMYFGKKVEEVFILRRK